MYSSTIEKRREHRPAHNMGIHMRYRIEEMIKAKCKARDIAQATGYSVSTIYKELKFGAVEQLTSGFETVKVYKADYAQLVYDTHMKNRSPRDLKIGNDIEFANFVEDKIINDRCSPYACLEKA